MASTTDLESYTTSPHDFYALLSITPDTFTPSVLRKAYRKTSLKYHPDKLGAAFSQSAYDLFQAAHGVLADPALKEKYDAHRAAAQRKERADALFEGRRRKMKEDLESREREGEGAAKKRKMNDEGKGEEFRKFVEEGRRKRAARQSMMSASSVPGTPTAATTPSIPKPANPPTPSAPTPTTKSEVPEVEEEDDEVLRLERRIQALAAKKAAKRARNSGIFTPSAATHTPQKPTNIESPKFSFSPATPQTQGKPASSGFAATMARLQAAEKLRKEEEEAAKQSV